MSIVILSENIGFMDIVIGVAAHKKFKMPKDSIYLPLHVGAKDDVDLGYTKDNTGNNIAHKNPYYCELTGLYWLWKNRQSDYTGLVHYRRHFAMPHTFFKSKKQYACILGREDLEELLRDYDILLPKKRRYYIESIYSHYSHSHYAEHLDKAREVIGTFSPDYLTAFDKVMKGTSAHMFNMMIMSKDKLDEYCSWLFRILFELEKRIDISGYDAFQARYLGRVSELLLDVFIEKNGYRYKELPVVTIGRVRWGRKIYSFLTAKFFGKKYKNGF